MRRLLGLQAPDSGAVQRSPELTIGYLPQKISVDATLPLTVERMLSLTNPVAPEAVREELEEVGAGHLMQAMMHELSGGE